MFSFGSSRLHADNGSFLFFILRADSMQASNQWFSLQTLVKQQARGKKIALQTSEQRSCSQIRLPTDEQSRNICSMQFFESKKIHIASYCCYYCAYFFAIQNWTRLQSLAQLEPINNTHAPRNQSSPCKM